MISSTLTFWMGTLTKLGQNVSSNFSFQTDAVADFGRHINQPTTT